ncbi:MULTISPECIES: nitronate monooxygenase [Psychrilyobacter]|uniref:Enoyl-[acyl-carrier-protein] reductase FabK n=1 Tax=Psychrilyobacter piezotolerans TaxID=2293438 RepID=A0ABX9KHZ6_9FUSO|nr:MULTISPECIES: nitronate monooxygenase [Psychrilyobacter]MCS5422978.1 nitronate monooxygenase [Psychrilyobacter sp. S5]NDI77501.1 enoyl-[acyl-carrier-protein] reductase FabK [Psychrilyobacter piezotolerans]RDE62986.1 enoyl-[acyl-carrier-protein] reductase FabK [Psychrilyobacter sp. S5]REI41744.1 enoyl-[acyl-carrier-protein] reductase FabK [Psychrilyobacter piezotolerans]
MKITELLGIEYPIFLGGMAQICMGEFAASVSNAGGLGVIASGGMSADDLRREIRICKGLTDKPFGVNIMLMMHNRAELAEVLVEEKVNVAVTGAGNPAPFLEMWKEAGIKVITVIPSVKIAKKMEALGVDAVVAEGTEAGGHVGETTTMALLPQVVDALSIPVIGAGGIADGRGVVAAFALGAQGVQVGTRFVATKECPVHENFKIAVLEASDTDTLVTGRSLGGPVRGIKNPMTMKFLELEKRSASRDELEELSLGSLRKAVFEGDKENGSVMAGQICGMVNEITTVKEAITTIFEEAKEVLTNLKTFN